MSRRDTKVTPAGIRTEVAVTLYDKVHAELLVIRKHTDGLTVPAIARSPALCSLLGGGHPEVAYNAFKHAALAKDSDTAHVAALYSLGLMSEGRTHLQRLTDFGETHGYDQRQARRHSDKGIQELAVFVSTQWTVQNVPVLTVNLKGKEDGSVAVRIHTRRLFVVEMREPVVTLKVGRQKARELELEWRRRDSGLHLTATARLAIEADDRGRTLRVTWRGELWPMHEFGHSELHQATWHTLGSSAAVTINSPGLTPNPAARPPENLN